MSGRALCALFSTCSVGATSIEDFYERYYRHDRYHGRGDDYVEAVLASGREDIAKYGVTAVSSKDSVTGATVAWIPKHSSEYK